MSVTTPRRARVVRAALLLLLSASLPLLWATQPASAQMALTVDSQLDEVDAVANDGNCISIPSGKCTLRAALQEIDAGGTVTVPAGVYALTIPPGTELTAATPDLSQGDLDITTDVTVVGAGADQTIIDGNGTNRVFDIHQIDGFAHIKKVTLRNGLAERSAPTGHVHGGIIHNHDSLEVSESTISGGRSNAGAPWGGGGITNAGNGTATLRNVTLAQNSTLYYGGGIENGGNITLSYVTISEDSAPANQGGGISSGVGFFGAGSATVDDSIFANNPGGSCAAAAGAITSAGYNLQDTGSCPFLSTGDQIGPPMLSAVNNPHGSIWVYALQPGSPAIDKASPLFCLPTDERGVFRPQEGDGVPPAFCDIGAFELEPPAPPAATCDGQTATIVGTSGNDTIRGTSAANVISGRGGNDTIYGRGGNDTICGGNGRDTLHGQRGNDRLFGQQDNDTLFGERGSDLLNGGANRDRCVGGAGNDTNVSCEQ